MSPTSPSLESAVEPSIDFNKRQAMKNSSKYQHDVTIITRTRRGTQTFVTSKFLLCRASRFFATVFNGKFDSAATSEIRLCIDSDIFAMVLNWTYHGKIVHPYNTKLDARKIHLAKLWKLSKHLSMAELQNQVMQAIDSMIYPESIEESIKEWKELAQFIFANDLEGDLLQSKLMNDLCRVAILYEGNKKDQFLEGVFGGGLATQLIKALIMDKTKGEQNDAPNSRIEDFFVKDSKDLQVNLSRSLRSDAGPTKVSFEYSNWNTSPYESRVVPHH